MQLKINKGINRPIEFKGLKAQYIGYLCIGLLVLLFLFAALYVLGLPILLVLTIISTVGGLLFSFIFKYSSKYGTYGLMKKAAFRRLPRSIKGCRLQKIFRKPTVSNQHKKQS